MTTEQDRLLLVACVIACQRQPPEDAEDLAGRVKAAIAVSDEALALLEVAPDNSVAVLTGAKFRREQTSDRAERRAAAGNALVDSVVASAKAAGFDSKPREYGKLILTPKRVLVGVLLSQENPEDDGCPAAMIGHPDDPRELLKSGDRVKGIKFDPVKGAFVADGPGEPGKPHQHPATIFAERIADLAFGPKPVRV